MPQISPKRANAILWTVQVLLALLFLVAGTMKFVMPIEKMQGPIALPASFLHFIGAAEILGAFGLILPGLFHVRTDLTPLAASGLVLIMIGAVVLTAIGMGIAPAAFPLVVGMLATSIAYGRSRVAPLRERASRQALQTV